MKTYKLNPKHLENVLRLSAPDRYGYFVKRVADWKTLWGLRTEDGWETASDDEGHELFPVWPHQRFAELCATGSWAASVPHAISLSEWFTEWTPELKEDGHLVAVFPLPGGAGIPVSPMRLADDLKEEISRL